MNATKEVVAKLTEMAHDLFTEPCFDCWVSELIHQPSDRWRSLIVELDKSGCPINKLLGFDETVRSKLVYRCMQSPDFRRSGEIMVIFSVAGWTWHSLIFHRPGNRSKSVDRSSE